MKIIPQVEYLYEQITCHKYYPVSLIFFFFLILIGYFMTWPIIGYDTDLWYHLSGGRYFWENGTIAKDAFFSFIAPPKSWYNYYWLFQVIVYKVFQWTGYYGLIILRCFLFALTALFICFFFVKRYDTRKALLIGLSVFVCCTLALTFREQLVRPHLFSYLLIVVFLYILEMKRDKIWLLPFLGVIWSNIHGIEYPVMILIILAYLTEMFYQNLRKKVLPPSEGKLSRWMLILTIYTVFCTPQIVELIRSPFDTALYQEHYVNELLPMQIGSIFSFSLFPFSRLIFSFQLGLILLTFVSFIVCLYQKQLRISHLILLLASTALLVTHRRFIYEFILLAIPMISHGFHSSVKPEENKKSFLYRTAPVLMIFILIIIPGLTYGSYFKNKPEYPFTQKNLPTGVVKFLNSLDVGGSIMNEPNTGGYFQWVLGRKYKIFMDMQLSVFSDQDFAYIVNAVSNENTFRTFIRRYDPSFISISREISKFSDFIKKFENFRPVFFDDQEILYINVQHFRQITDAYELKYIDPFNYGKINFETETRERLSLIFDEAMKMRKIDPDCEITSLIIANILLSEKKYEQALPYVETVIIRYPERAKGYMFKGHALFGLERFKEAVGYYQISIDKGLEADLENVYRNLNTSYIRLKEYKKAYQVFKKFVNPFSVQANYKDIYQLGVTAAAAGKLRDAIHFLKIAEMKLSPDDAEYAKKIQDNLLLFDPERKKAQNSK